MDRYTLYCTPEQTIKALELDAPVRYASAKDIRLERYVYVGGDYFTFPTAEQMLGWLDEQGLKISLLYDYEFHGKWDYDSDYKGNQMPCTSMGVFDTRKSATLDAIDEALKFLETHKQ